MSPTRVETEVEALKNMSPSRAQVPSTDSLKRKTDSGGATQTPATNINGVTIPEYRRKLTFSPMSEDDESESEADEQAEAARSDNSSTKI